MDSTERARAQGAAPVDISLFDLEGHATTIDEVFRCSLGYSREEFAEMPFTAYSHPDDIDASVGRFARLATGEIDRYAIERRVIAKDGGVLWVAVTLALVRDVDGNPDHVICVTQDITERKQREGDPRAEEQRARLQVERIPAIVYVAATGPTGGWLYVSPQIEAILGFTADEWVADPGLWLRQLHPQDRDFVVADEESALLAANAADRIYSNTYRLHHRNGAIVWVRDDAMMLWDTQGRATFHGVMVDVTAQKLLEERLEHQAFHDPLTGLPNRKLFHYRVGHALSRRQTGPVAVLFIDLDNFKTVNDSFGHACGDEVIVAAARRLQTCARAGDTAARLGGDEFALLVEDVNAEAVLVLADRVLDALGERPVEFSGRTLTIGASVGIALAGPGESTETLLRNADLAMYEAKLQGRSRRVFYEPAMHATAMNRFRLKEAFQTALTDGAITLAYQPIVNLRTGAVVGIEALARWLDHQLGDVPPTDFIPVAEETGLIHQLGHWAIEQACADLTRWRSTHHIPAYVSVNVSPLLLDDDQFVSSVVRLLLAHDLEPSALTLEVTEGAPLEARRRESLRDLRAHGVRVAIADFGTGYSSLSYLRQLPVDMVKIDQTFLGPIVDTSAEPAFLRAIIRLAETMHLVTICEGIETPDQLSDLQEAGCGYGQGNLFARPSPLADVSATAQLVI